MKSGKPGNCDTDSALQPGEPGDCSSAIQHTREKKKKHLVLCHDPNATTILPDKLQFVSCSANLQIKLNLEK